MDLRDNDKIWIFYLPTAFLQYNSNPSAATNSTAPTGKQRVGQTELVPQMSKTPLRKLPKMKVRTPILQAACASSDSRKVFPVIFAMRFGITPSTSGIINSKYMNGEQTWWLKNSYTVPTTSVTTVATVQNVSPVFFL